MNSLVNLFSLGLCLALTACATRTTLHSLKSGYLYSTGEPSPDTKIFLVAGSSDNANFNQEIVDQLAYWQSRGYRRDEIACYFVPPADQNKDDSEQFRAVKNSLSACFLANPKVLFAHLRSLANSPAPAFYVYVTSHGSRPYRHLKLTDFESPEEREKFKRLVKLKSWTHAYTLDLSAEKLEDGGLLIEDSPYRIFHYAEANPDQAADYIFTPSGFLAALRALPAVAQKIVVLQGCFSGGFIEQNFGQSGVQNLRALERGTVLTASDHRNSSFGCDSGSTTTYFGRFFLEALRAQKQNDFTKFDWAAVYRQTARAVKELEQKEFREEGLHSHPQFYRSKF